MFWITAGLLTLVALGFLFYPFVRSLPKTRQIDRQAENLRAHKLQLSELKQAHAAGEFTDEDYQQLENELKLRLVEDTEKLEARSREDLSRPRWLVPLAGVVLVVFAFSVYYQLGGWRDVRLREAMLAAGQSPEQQQVFFNQMEERVERHPDNIEDLFFLGKTYFGVGRTQDAERIFEKALIVAEKNRSLNPTDHSWLISNLIQARFSNNDRVLSHTDKQMLKTALELAPTNTMALGLLGVDAFASGDFAQALINWRKMLKVMPANEAEAVQSAITMAENNLKAAGKPIPKDESAVEPTIVLAVTIDLSDELKQQLDGARSLFVAARQVNGPPMPVAVQRLSVPSSFPVTIQLDDTTTMAAMTGLQDGMNIEIVARLSKGGVATAQAGDLEGLSQPLTVKVGEQATTVLIDKVH
ncbi:c-type cytochrome biogenesis protein CcmI [Gynuella sp.]|uniref:c-type cytochrome biogenesis protein CcmI n=1 Tax=Gynuella sp. TaxID=2969146 RepID=UPI003D10078D